MKKIISLIIISVSLSFAAFADIEPNLLDTVYVEANKVTNRTITGRYMFIPDSLLSGVQSVLKGLSVVVRDDSKVDPDEKIIIGNDTVNFIIKEKNFGRYDRGLFNYIYIPKGEWQFGLSASYGEFSSQDMQILDLLTDLDLKGEAFSIKPSVSYFIKNNTSIGLRLGYTSTKASLESMGVDFDEDLNFNLSNVYYKNESFSAALAMRHYIGLSRSGRFGIFNEVELAFSSGNGDFSRKYNDRPKITHTTYYDARLNFSPGLSVFMMKNVSFNISFGVFGFYLRKDKQTTNGEVSGDRLTSGANFKFNIFNINFGLGIHI